MPTDPTDLKTATLFAIGLPIDESAKLSEHAIQTLQKCSLVIGESRKVASRRLREAKISEENLFCLDNQADRDWEDLRDHLHTALVERENVALFSDVGMPILFDPGKRVLDFCRSLNFQIRSVPGPTSWATACALSGFEPPFLLLGFLPREKEDRKRILAKEVGRQAHCVFMETPYRFTLLIDELEKSFGTKRLIFLAWEIGKESEWLFWGSLSDLKKQIQRRSLKKGEFVLITQSSSSGEKSLK